MNRYQNKYRSDSARMKNWDYGSPGYYYVTICTKNRKGYFGNVIACDCPSHPHRYVTGAHPWEGMRGGMVGTHNYASLPPDAHPAHDGIRPAHSSHVVVRLTPIGETALQNWLDIPNHFPFVVLDEFVIMPNHIHGILCFKKPGFRRRTMNSFGPQSENLGSVIRNFKGATKSWATCNQIEFAWQPRFHDDVIISDKRLDDIRKYIQRNPQRWFDKDINQTP